MMQSSRNCSRTLLHVTGLSSSWWLISIVPIPDWQASIELHQVVMCISPNESVAAS